MFELLGLYKSSHFDYINISNPLKHFLIFSYFLPNKNFNINDPIFLCKPLFVVGIPVCLANFCLALVIPTALFQEKLNPYFFDISSI